MILIEQQQYNLVLHILQPTMCSPELPQRHELGPRAMEAADQ